MSQQAVQLSIHQQRVPIPACLPRHVRDLLLIRGQVCSERLPKAGLPASLHRFFRTPERLTVSEHALRYRVVTDGAHEGRWRAEYAPHTTRIMDTFGQPHVREIFFCGVEQSGKTNTMLNCLLWTIEQNPGNVFYLMPSEDTSDKVTSGKIKPMLTRSPHMATFLSERQDDTTLSRIALKNGVTIFPAHANSASAMATWPAKYCFGDEVDKYPERTGNETDPITLLRKRTRTYSGREKCFFASTPAGRFIYGNGLQKCHQIWQWRVRCPQCQQLIRMDAEHLALDDQATIESVEINGCAYACNECGVLWNEQDRRRAILGGCWMAVKGADLARPEKVGFHHRAWECLDVSLREIASAWLRARGGDLAAGIAWANGYEALDFEQVQSDRREEQILQLVDASLPRSVAPIDTSAIILLVDTQRRGFHYQVWAVGWPDELRRDLPLAMIEHGFVERFDHLADLAAKRWQDAAGQQYSLQAALIDSGGGTDPYRPKHSRTMAVYEFCRRNPLFKPLKGYASQAQPWAITRLDYYPSRSGKKIPIPGGLNLYRINVTHYKNDLAQKLMIEPGDPGAIRLHASTGNGFAAQMCAEYQDERGRWQCPRNKDNHHWDCSVYMRALVDIMGLANRRRPQQNMVEAPRRRVLSRGITA